MVTITPKNKQLPTANLTESLIPPKFKNCKTNEQVEEMLWVWFTEQVQKYEPVDGYPKVVNPNSKWRVTSCMQKAIRRGDTEIAIKMASALVVFDPVYFLSRINVVALEDVGLANPIVVASILSFSGKNKTLDSMFGLVRVAQFWVSALAEGIKDRTLCDLVAMTEYSKMYAQRRADLSHLDYTNLTSTGIHDLVMAQTTMADQAIVLRFVSGTYKHKADTYIPKDGSYEAMLDFYWEYTTPLVAYIAYKGSKKSVYHMWQHLYLSYLWVSEPNTTKIRHTAIAPPIKIMGVASYAYDMHTQEGKKAYAYFIKVCKPIRDYLQENNLKYANMSAPAFIGDTGLCNKLLDYPKLDELFKTAFGAEFDNNGLTVDQGNNLVRLIQENMEELNNSRYYIAVGAKRD